MWINDTKSPIKRLIYSLRTEEPESCTSLLSRLRPQAAQKNLFAEAFALMSLEGFWLAPRRPIGEDKRFLHHKSSIFAHLFKPSRGLELSRAVTDALLFNCNQFCREREMGHSRKQKNNIRRACRNCVAWYFTIRFLHSAHTLDYLINCLIQNHQNPLITEPLNAQPLTALNLQAIMCMCRFESRLFR